MRITEIRPINDKFYKLVGRFTLDEITRFPDDCDKMQLSEMEFEIENVISHKGFWFRPCFSIDKVSTRLILTPPPQIEEEVRK